jgi:hypothetical protein
VRATSAPVSSTGHPGQGGECTGPSYARSFLSAGALVFLPYPDLLRDRSGTAGYGCATAAVVSGFPAVPIPPLPGGWLLRQRGRPWSGGAPVAKSAAAIAVGTFIPQSWSRHGPRRWRAIRQPFAVRLRDESMMGSFPRLGNDTSRGSKPANASLISHSHESLAHAPEPGGIGSSQIDTVCR